jgi:hypothetical protein
LKERIQVKRGIWNLDKKTKWNSNLRHGTSQNPSPKAEQERKEGWLAGLRDGSQSSTKSII